VQLGYKPTGLGRRACWGSRPAPMTLGKNVQTKVITDLFFVEKRSVVANEEISFLQQPPKGD